MLEAEKYNQGIRYRARKIQTQLRASLLSMKVGQTGELLKAVSGAIKYKQTYGMIDSIGFLVTKGGVMTRYGVGKGVTIDSARNNSSTIHRKQKDWYDPVLDQNVPDIASWLAAQNADALLNAIKI